MASKLWFVCARVRLAWSKHKRTVSHITQLETHRHTIIKINIFIQVRWDWEFRLRNNDGICLSVCWGVHYNLMLCKLNIMWWLVLIYSKVCAARKLYATGWPWRQKKWIKFTKYILTAFSPIILSFLCFSFEFGSKRHHYVVNNWIYSGLIQE